MMIHYTDPHTVHTSGALYTCSSVPYTKWPVQIVHLDKHQYGCNNVSNAIHVDCINVITLISD